MDRIRSTRQITNCSGWDGMQNPNRSLVAATFEKANTYVFAGLVIMNPTPGKFINPNHIGL